MAKTLSTIAESQLDRKDIKKRFRLTIGGTNVRPYVISYGLSHDTNFGIASMSCNLINNNGIFSDGGSSEINMEDEVILTEYYGDATDSFINFTGYVRQRRKVKAGGNNTMALTCLDFLVKLEDTDIEQKFEATKVAVSAETLTPSYITTAGSENLAQIFDFANDSIALDPPPTISILDNYSAIEYPQDSGYQINHEEGQVIFGSAFNARTEYDAKATYSFYPIGLHIEDIIEDIIVAVDGYSNYLFGESSEADVISNHLTETYNNMEGTNTDTLTPNVASQIIAIETALTTAVTAGDTSIAVISTSGFPSSGSGEVNGDDFTWTGKTATTLTGIPATGDDALRAHPIAAHVIYSTSYAAGIVWSHSYNNHITTLTSSDYTVPSGSAIDYIDKRQGRIILNGSISILSIVTCNTDYSFKTLQSTGIETPDIEFTYQKTKNRLEAIKKLKELLAPNYVLRTIGTDKIWGNYLTQKSTEDYTLKCVTSLDYAEDTDIYTRTKFFGKNDNPTNVCWQENLAFLTTGETYTATATNTALTWDRTEGEWQVYSTGLPEGSIITSTFQPRVRINGVQINNQLHQVVMQPVTVESWGLGEIGGRPKYRFRLHFSWGGLSNGRAISCYNATGVLTKTIAPNDPYMNFEQGVFNSGAVDENDPWRTWLTISTASFWVNWSIDLLQIDFAKAEFKVHTKLIPASQLAQVKVTADYEYQTVIEGIRNGEYILDGRWSTQAQTVWYQKPASGFIYFKCDLGSTYSVQAIDLVAGFYKPDNRENFDNLDNRRKFDMNNTYTLKYSTDNVTYYNVAKEAVRFNLSGGQALSLERSVLGDDFEARYFQLEINDMSQVMYGGGVWVAAFTQLSIYNNLVLIGESTLVPYTELSVASTLGAATITVDDTTGFTSSGTAYLDEDAFTYTGKTTTTFTGCSSVIAHAIDTRVSQSVATTSTVYDVAGLLGRVGDKVYKNMELNEYLSTTTKINKRAKDWLTEYQKDHSKLTAATLYGPHFRVGQTLQVVDNLNNISKRYFIDSIRNNSGGINLGLARYP